MPVDPNTQQANQVQQGNVPSGMPQGPGQQSPMGGQPGGPPNGISPQGAPTAAQGGDPTNAGATDPSQPNFKAILDAVIEETNMAKRVDEDVLKEIGETCVKGYEIDKESCSEWLENNRDWMKMALLMREDKTYPWPGASNVKFPLLVTAAMQFAARAYPTLVPADNQLVKTRVIGFDPDGTKADKADRVAKHMSFLIMHRMPRWEEDMDKLLFMLALSGLVFKKTYRCSIKKTVISELVFAEDLIVNYWARSLDTAYRKTEHLFLTKNDIESKVRSEEFLDLGDLGPPSAGNIQNTTRYLVPRANDDVASGNDDDSTPHLFLAQHTFYDIDDDGYAEPVVVVVHHATKKVARITARWASDGIELDAKGKKVVCIKPLEYFTDYQFLPNPDGSIYGLGFGSLLGPINESVNTIINQLVDAGTLNNLQSGFISRGLRLAMKDTRLLPGEWRAVNASGDDLKSGLFPVPSKEPSEVLRNLMTMLIQAGQQLASVADIMVGKMPGQNTPASTTQETVDQSMKVFTAVYKRTYRSLLREFLKIKNLLRLSPDILATEGEILGIPLSTTDYDDNDHDIIPAADPTGASVAAQFGQLQQIGQTLMSTGVINAQEFAMRNLKLIQIADPEKLIQQPPPPPPDPKLQTEQIKQQTMQQKSQDDTQFAQLKMQMEQEKAQLEAHMKQVELQFKEREMQIKVQEKQMDLRLSMIEGQMRIKQDAQTNAMQLQADRAHHIMDLKHDEIQNQQALRHGEMQNEAKVDSMKQQAKVKQSTSRTNNS